jgi:ankyrin repeat protein
VNARDHNGETPLYWAAYFGSLECVKCLVDAGADVDAESSADTKTALDVAVKGRYAHVVKYLRDCGAIDKRTRSVGAKKGDRD